MAAPELSAAPSAVESKQPPAAAPQTEPIPAPANLSANPKPPTGAVPAPSRPTTAAGKSRPATRQEVAAAKARQDRRAELHALVVVFGGLTVLLSAWWVATGVQDYPARPALSFTPADASANRPQPLAEKSTSSVRTAGAERQASPLVHAVGPSAAPERDHSDDFARQTAGSFRLNVNTATRGELDTLPGIGPVLASSILAHRERMGGFRSAEDLLAVPGIGTKTFKKLEPYIEFGPAR